MKTQRPPLNHLRNIHVTIESRGVELNDARRLAIRRMVAGALRRFAPRVRSIRVWLEDVNGPRGGVDTRCRIEIRMRPQGTITASGLATDEHAAVANAALRARQLVSRHFKRIRALRRRALVRV